MVKTRKTTLQISKCSFVPPLKPLVKDEWKFHTLLLDMALNLNTKKKIITFIDILYTVQ